MVIDPNAVRAALEKRNNNPEPEARFMRMTNGYAVAYALRQSCTIRSRRWITRHLHQDTLEKMK
jgi:hypothetical protein